ncbi:MAG TPA: Stp1/IreP family PP2C-type Ser/Thr phosphatase [Bacteriovoracaceae bacterium]|nr:Stp1/IreP family PP2C-type Ser/Thr phosphatase [Bacteriovoracaceae bacterium]
MGILCRGGTDIGRKRKTNQDSICLDHPHLFYSVADGMGGHNGGDIASQISVRIMPEYIKKNLKTEPQELMKNVIHEINQAIYQKAQEQPELHGMGTTITAIQFCGPQLVIGNVGDSRAYMINNHNIYQLTRDHSWVQQRLNLGVYTREEAVHDPQRNALYIAVGIDPELDVDIFNYRICKNDIFLICSDGLHGKVSDADILHIVLKNIPDPSKCNLSHIDNAVKALIDQANQNGGNDNISAILAVAQA